MQQDVDDRRETLRMGRAVSIMEAALHLGVSERTVYRMLRSGKLSRVKLSDDTVRVTVIIPDITPIQPQNSVNMSDNLSDSDMTRLREDLRARDAQVAQLLATQQELTTTIQRMQDQLFELACLVVRQRSDIGATGQGDSTSHERLPASLRDLFRFGRRRSDRAKTEQKTE